MARTRQYRASKKVTPLTCISPNRGSVPESIARSAPIAANVPSSTTINGRRVSLRRRTVSAKVKQEIEKNVRLQLNPPKGMDKSSDLVQQRTDTVIVEGKKRPALRLMVNLEKVREERRLLIPESLDLPKLAKGETSNTLTSLDNVYSSKDLSSKKIEKELQENATRDPPPLGAGVNFCFRADHSSTYQYRASNTSDQAHSVPVTVKRRWMSSGVECVWNDPVPEFGISNLRHTVVPQRQPSLSPSPSPSGVNKIDKNLQSHLDHMPVPDIADLIAGFREKGLGDASKRQKERARKSWIKRGKEEFESFWKGLPGTWPKDEEME